MQEEKDKTKRNVLVCHLLQLFMRASVVFHFKKKKTTMRARPAIKHTHTKK
jgi:hypothetical protein